MKRPIFDSLVETASDHHGYVTTLQAREAGVDPTQLRLLASRGRLEHVARGVYRVPVLPRSEHDDLAFAIAWARDRYPEPREAVPSESIAGTCQPMT